MNKERLIDIILKDIDELNELTKEISKSDSTTKLETDIALSKTTLVYQEFLLFKEKYACAYQHPVAWEVVTPVISEIKTEEKTLKEPDAPIVPEINKEKPEPEKEEFKVSSPILIMEEQTEMTDKPEEEIEEMPEDESNIQEENDEVLEENEEPLEDLAESMEENEGSSEKEDEPLEENEKTLEEDMTIPEENEDNFDVQEDIPEEEEDDFVEEEDDLEEEEEEVYDDGSENEGEEEEQEKPGLEHEEEEIEENDNGFEENPEDKFEEEPELSEERRTIGENFHSEKSVNDKMGNHNTLDQKIANGPISSLQAAIGINDRFLFIREIFNNDAELYDAAIKRLDECADIREAVEYLSSNFRIKKTEISLSFVELIRRRFLK